jgi:Cu-Zn family superoxide dismutase
MNLSSSIISGIAALLAAAPAYAQTSEPAAPPARTDIALIGAQGQTLGMASLEQTPAGVLVSVSASGIPEGEHAFHVHEKGVCDAAGGFASAGGHFAPDGTAHGYRDAKGHHAGDMPNLFAGPDGKLRAQVLNSAVRLGESGEGALSDADGSALVIHGGADDYASQPSGAAGSRIACAVIAPPRPN